VSVEPLPPFRYHPDPLATDSIELRDESCVACGRRRGAVYAGPVYAETDLDERLCPWCIADGTAAEGYGAEFIETGDDVADDVPDVGLPLGARQGRWLDWLRLPVSALRDASRVLGVRVMAVRDEEGVPDQRLRRARATLAAS
jgi:uncharacterized protein CbrC (UPF0167 family)